MPTATTGVACAAGITVAVLAGGVGAAEVAPRTLALAAALTGGADASPLGGGTALVMGGSGVPIPPPSYLDSVEKLYLDPLGFHGTAKPLFTPELFYPGNISEAQGADILATAITGQIADDQVDAANPVVVFGYSQSAAMTAMTMQQLHQAGVSQGGVSPELVHFVLVGNSANPDGGILERFDIPSGGNLFIPWLSLTTGHPTPDIYPTDVYTIEYDGYADFPRYPLNLLADLNAVVGMFTTHLDYLFLSEDQIANARPLETTGDTLTHYYMIPSQTLPLLDLVRLQPIIGNPLADLLEPDLRILVNLGYGSIDHGWGDGPANVSTPIDLLNLFPPNVNLLDVGHALIAGAQQGFQAAMRDLTDPANYQLTSLWDNPIVQTISQGASLLGLGDLLPEGAVAGLAADAGGLF